MKHLTVRNVPRRLAQALKMEQRRRGKSLNETVIELLSQSLGTGSAGRRENGLSRLAGTWNEEEFRQFEESIAGAEQIDEELWR